MAHWRRFVAKLCNLLVNKHAEEELAREIASHLALLTGDFERRGMSPGEARLAARRAYGGVEQDRHRGSSHLLSPATPPDKRVRIRRFEKLRL